MRGLAQRSAEAAKEIKTLISASTVQVENGVLLVDRTGAALKGIMAKVSEMDALVQRISAASQEQATGIAEINTAVSQMDQVVQQNAAMVEESTAATHALKQETRELSSLLGHFDLGIEERRSPQDGRSRHASPVHAVQANLARRVEAVPRMVAAAPALKVAGSALRKANAAPEQDWQEF